MNSNQRFIVTLAAIIMLGTCLFRLAPAQEHANISPADRGRVSLPPGMPDAVRRLNWEESARYRVIDVDPKSNPRLFILVDFEHQTVTHVSTNTLTSDFRVETKLMKP